MEVLVAEDNEINQKLMAAILTKLGCPFKIVGNGEEALREIMAKYQNFKTRKSA